MKPVNGVPLLFSGATSLSVTLVTVDETKIGAYGFAGLLAARI